MIGITTFNLLGQSVGIFGLRGVDTILSFIIVKLIQTFIKSYKKDILGTSAMKKLMDQFAQIVNPPSSMKQNMAKNYPLMLKSLVKLWPSLIEIVIKTGRAQLLRRHIASELNVCGVIIGNNCFFNSFHANWMPITCQMPCKS